MGSDDKELIKQQQDPRHDQSPFKIDIEPDYKVSYVASSLDTSTIASSTIDSSTVTLNTSTIGTHTFDDDYIINSTYDPPIEFEDEMPSMSIVNEMCAEYPTLKTAYEKFKTVYKMVEQDYKGKIENEWTIS